MHIEAQDYEVDSVPLGARNNQVETILTLNAFPLMLSPWSSG